jgi:hypothetical protein
MSGKPVKGVRSERCCRRSSSSRFANEKSARGAMPMREREPEETSERGVVIIDLMGD